MATILGPPLAGYGYRVGAANGVAGLPFYQIASFYLLAELLFRSMSAKEMGVENEGKSA